MPRYHAAFVVTVLSLLLGACASAQRVTVTTAPSGAQVTLIRYGVIEAQGSVAGIAIGGIDRDFEDAPIVLGTSPVEYEFELEQRDQEVAVGGAFVQVVRRFTEGLIRAERNGAVAERRVRFDGDAVDVDLTLPEP
jgi:hypothetical protein